MAAGEREWDERPILPAAVAPAQASGSGWVLWVLIALAVPVAFGVLFLVGVLVNAVTGQ